jgi:hypothetical protein
VTLTAGSRLGPYEIVAPLGDIRKSWAAATKAANVPGLRFHDLRRSGVRNLIRAGVPQSVAMSISGHRTVATFLRYDIASDEDKREALRKVEALAAEAGKSNVVPIKHGENTENRGPERKSGSRKSLKNMVRPARFERATFSSGG